MKEDKVNIFILDHDKDNLEYLTFVFQKNRFEVQSHSSSINALEIIKKNVPDILLLEVSLPGINGIQLCEEIREVPELNNLIIVFITERCEEYSQIAGFKAGADDYICKPIKPLLLISRLNAILARTRNTMGEKADEKNLTSIENKGLIIDKDKYLVYYKERRIELPRKEFEILSLMASKPDKVFSREEVYSKIWKRNIQVDNRTIDVHIRKIRIALEADIIKTIKGVGYKLVL